MLTILKRTGKRVGLGQVRAWYHRARKVGWALASRESMCRFRYLQSIVRASPIRCGGPGVEAHTLLHHRRIYEGLWALYSFAFFAGRPCRFVVHDDGTLTDQDIGHIHRLLPGTRVIARADADRQAISYLRSRNLEACVRLREEFVLALKLFDLSLFAENASFIFFDSDVLFYDTPVELLDGLDSDGSVVGPLISKSVIEENYTLELGEMEVLVGGPCLARVNSGIIRTPRTLPDLDRVERYLRQPHMQHPRRFPWFREQTCWAMEVSRPGGRLLSDDYAIWGVPSTPGMVAGHFAGPEAPAARLYTDALPYLHSRIFAPAAACAPAEQPIS